MEKIKIEKGMVQEPLLIPLYGRKYAMDRYPDLFMDHDCQAIFEQIDFHPEDGIVFFASGVFYYFKKTDVEKLFTAMAEHFTGGKLIFDATKKKGLKSMLKTWLKGFEMKDINVYFSVDDVHTLKELSSHISSAVSNPYLAGYRPLDKRYGFITNMVFRHLDRSKMCQIIELEFD